MGRLVKVAKVGDIAINAGKVIEFGEEAIALFNVNGEFYAINNTCLHRGGPLGEGELNGKIVTCPWHGWEYDVTTGENVYDPKLKVKTYKVLIQGSDIFIEI